MSEIQETIVDIVAEMRDRKKMLGSAISSAPLCYPVDGMEAKVEILDEFIDRIDAAYRVEALKWVEANAGLAKLVDPEKMPTGNGAKMRESLKEIAYGYCRGCGGENDQSFCDSQSCSEEVELRPLVQLARAALAEPPRNCDVGTAEEQEMRFSNWCDLNQKELKLGRDNVPYAVCSKCPIEKSHEDCNGDTVCGVYWGQMPYEEGGGK